MNDPAPRASWPDADAQIGFFGKIPTRGDFVRAGLPRSFVSPWDDWLQVVLAASKDALGEQWQAAWMEAPVWRFLLQPGICGPDTVLGVFMPSVDRAGRYFPLTLACVAPGPNGNIAAAQDWLNNAEAAGIAALEQDIEPDGLSDLLSAATEPSGAEPIPVPVGECAWWTEGAPRVPAAAFATGGLPGPELFVRMIDAQDATASALPRS